MEAYLLTAYYVLTTVYYTWMLLEKVAKKRKGH